VTTDLERNSDVPLYFQVSEILRKWILEGKWPLETTLPSELDLCEEFNVARGTMRHALSRLEQEGYVLRERGRGTRVIWGGEHLQDAGRASQQIAFVVPYVRDSFVSTILLGVERAAAERGWSITFKHVNNSSIQQAEVLNALAEQGTAGSIVYPVDSVHAEPLSLLARAGYPLVLVDRYLRGVVTDYVMSDHFGGAIRATQHLIQLGHTQIAFISWSDPAISLEHRHAGYIQALSEAGLRYDPALTCEVEAYPTINADSVAAFLKQRPGVTAVFAANDQIALAVYKIARQIGVRIPEDLALVGFDDLDFTAHLDVPLTTVAQPAFEIGETAVEMLSRRISDRVATSQQIVLPTRLVVRRSCGAFLKDERSRETPR